MSFRHYDALRVFTHVARHGSFSAAAASLHLTRGAISHQMRQLEASLGFPLFHRRPRGITLTVEGRTLFTTCAANFAPVETLITRLRNVDVTPLTIGLTTYFASRWLSARLMGFMQAHPDVRIRLQPMVDLTDLDGEGVDLAIRWGDGRWTDVDAQPLFHCPAWPCGHAEDLKRIQERGADEAFAGFTLLHDRPDSHAWARWFRTAGLSYPGRADTLIIPDPNVRVEAVVNRQGVALNDALVERELSAGSLHRLSDIELSDYGYFLVFADRTTSRSEVDAFCQWLLREAADPLG